MKVAVGDRCSHGGSEKRLSEFSPNHGSSGSRNGDGPQHVREDCRSTLWMFCNESLVATSVRLPLPNVLTPRFLDVSVGDGVADPLSEATLIESTRKVRVFVERREFSRFML